MDKIKTTNQLKKTWIQLELAKREKTNELWLLEAQIEKIKSKIKSYGMDQDLGMDEELIAVPNSIAARAAAMLFGTGCSISHKVVQSAYNTATGDSIIIKYEQWGKTIKK